VPPGLLHDFAVDGRRMLRVALLLGPPSPAGAAGRSRAGGCRCGAAAAPAPAPAAAGRAPHWHALKARDRALHRQLAAERGRLLDRFWDRVTAGLPVGDAGARLRAAGTPELPADPAPEQLDAWLELAADEDFQRTTRANAAWGAQAVGADFDPDAWTRRVGGALALAAELRAAGVEPGDPRAAEAVAPMARGFAELLGRRDGPGFRRWLVGQLDAHTDPQAERYWQLVGIVQGRPQEEFTARTADYAWLLAALRHDAARPGSRVGRPPAKR
jgi:hypothetical protein